MPFLTKASLKTHMRAEIIDLITRQDDTIIDEAITAGIGEAKSYLNRYDKDAIFGVGGADPSFSDGFFTRLVKNIVVWHLVILSNPNISMEVARAAYEDAIKFLAKARDGKADPDWPLRSDTPVLPDGSSGLPTWGGENVNPGVDLSGHISFNSNQRRRNHW